MKEITILAFNFGNAGRYANGPGICLFNFATFLNKLNEDIKVNIFTALPTRFSIPGVNIRSLYNHKDVCKAIDRSDIVHHWSGLIYEFSKYIKYANSQNKFVVVGPNVLDCVEFDSEKKLLDNIQFNKVLTVNERLRFLISNRHKIKLSDIDIFMVGPDINLWKPSEVKSNKILWKGNSKQFVKDIGFALRVQKKLPQYEFEFIGHPKPYNYFDHIEQARQAKLYFTTSLSETMGLGLVEQWAAGIPSVTHPKIYLHGISYQTGIITNRSVDDYCEAIVEIMENDSLYNELSIGAQNYAYWNFADHIVITNYLNIVRDVL